MKPMQGPLRMKTRQGAPSCDDEALLEVRSTGEAIMTMGMVYWEHHHVMLLLGLRVLVTLNQCLMKTLGSSVLGIRDGTGGATCIQCRQHYGTREG